MSVKTSTRVWEYSNQSSSDLLLLLAIADHSDDDGVCWPGIPRLAKKTRCSERQTQRNVEKLEKRGELFVSHQRGRGNSNLYFVTSGLNQQEIAKILQNRFDYRPNEAHILAGKLLDYQRDNAIKPDTDDTFCDEKKVTSSTIKGDIQGEKVTSSTIKGDIAMSPEPSIEPSFKPSESRVQKTLRPAVIPAVKIHAEVTGKFLNKAQIKELAEVIGDSPIALEEWRNVVKAWLLKGHSEYNISGMLDWFKNGIPQYKNISAGTLDQPRPIPPKTTDIDVNKLRLLQQGAI